MGAFVDLVTALFPVRIAAIIVVLAVVDALQVKYLARRLDEVNGRVRRLEDVFIHPDGGCVDDESDDPDR
jgi:hypothetical protein